MPKGYSLGENESIIGFGHTHSGTYSEKNEFSAGDFASLFYLMSYKYKWMGTNPSGEYYMKVIHPKVTHRAFVYNSYDATHGLFDDVFSKPSGRWLEKWQTAIWAIQDWNKYGIDFKPLNKK